LKKLEKKRLAIVSKQKPLVCSAVPPEEAFAELVGLHERRVKNMKRIIDHLQKLNDEGQRPKGSEERRYFVLDANSALDKIADLIAHSRASISATLDKWGLRLISECRPSMIKALTNGAKIRIIVGAHSVGSESMSDLPEPVEVRLSRTDAISSNLLIIDASHLISIDSNNGKAALFPAQDSFGSLQSKAFEHEWIHSTDLGRLANADPARTTKAVELARVLENGISGKMLELAISSNVGDMPAELVDIIDKDYGLQISRLNPAEMLDLVDSSLRICCLGGLKHDRTNNILSVQSKVDSKHALPWALVLASYFRRSGNEVRILQQGGKNLQLVHLRLSKPVLP
jgi:sugar-specific transcriptional regulator TrmB